MLANSSISASNLLSDEKKSCRDAEDGENGDGGRRYVRALVVKNNLQNVGIRR